MIRVVLVDDHELVRGGLSRAFERAGDFTVAGEADCVRDGQAKVAALEPDAVVVDVRLPDGSGMDLARKLRNSHPSIGIVVLTMYAGDEHLFAALDAGANAFVDKSAPTSEVVQAARQAVANPSSFSAADLGAAMKRRDSVAKPMLTTREGQVLALLADGFGVAQIARRLHIGESTTKTHIGKIYGKLGAGNRAQAIMAAMRLGLIKVPQDGSAA